MATKRAGALSSQPANYATPAARRERRDESPDWRLVPFHLIPHFRGRGFELQHCDKGTVWTSLRKSGKNDKRCGRCSTLRAAAPLLSLSFHMAFFFSSHSPHSPFHQSATLARIDMPSQRKAQPGGPAKRQPLVQRRRYLPASRSHLQRQQ